MDADGSTKQLRDLSAELKWVAEHLNAVGFTLDPDQEPSPIPALKALILNLAPEHWQADPAEAIRTMLRLAVDRLERPDEPFKPGTRITARSFAWGIYNLANEDLAHLDGERYSRLIKQTFAVDTPPPGDRTRGRWASQLREKLARALVRLDAPTGVISEPVETAIPDNRNLTADELAGMIGKPWNYVQFFMAGCGYGNRMIIMPVPNEAGAVDGGFVEFIDALLQIGFDQADLRQLGELGNDLLRVNVEDPEFARSRITQYFDLMNDVPDKVRDFAAMNEWDWFNLGRLIYELTTYVSIEINSESSGDQTDPYASDSVRIAHISLQQLRGSIDVPPSVEELIDDYLEAIASKVSIDVLLNKANYLALCCHSILLLIASD